LFRILIQRSAAKLVRQYLENQISFMQLVEKYPKNTANKEIDELFDMVSELPNAREFPTAYNALKKIITGRVKKLEN
jgi:hypothetical protein